jgi:carbamoyl-phosphate synthase small subunit
VKNFSEAYSRKSADSDLQDYLDRNGIVGISDIDTRALVRHIRDKGAMNAIISSEILDVNALKVQLKAVPPMEGLELASKVSTKEPYEYGDSNAGLRVAVLDLGVKNSILNNLAQRGCFLKIFPAKTKIAKIESWNPDGFFLSNGPGDPGTMDYAMETAGYFIENDYPVFGICLGHQIIARSLGITTYKMHHGHRGANHPVINTSTKRSEITTQNHGFGVDPESIKSKQDLIDITHINLNDNTIEGIRVKSKDVFSVQYHPEASPGPHDSRYLFDQFIDNIKKHKS